MSRVSRLDRRALLIPAVAFGALAFAAVAWAVGARSAAQPALQAGLVLSGAPIVWRTARHAVGGHFATDIVASLAIVGAVAIGQPVAGLIVVLMQSGGEALERFAAGRASAALQQLEADAPRIARRLAADGTAHDVRVDEIAVGDRLVLRPGDVVPCDSEVIDGHSHLDVSRITGEPLPRRTGAGDRLPSGAHNLEGALTARAVARASESQYAQIVALVRSAQESKAPLQRLADRYAVWFTPITLALCVVTWAVTRDASRVLAILTVATPCPLILATPVAIVGGISQAARRHMIVRDGAALEALAAVDAIVVDKTGTVTTGVPAVTAVVPRDGLDEERLLRLAGSLEQVTSHVVGKAVVAAASARGVELSFPSHVRELPGEGISGLVNGERVEVGGREFIERALDRSLHSDELAPTGRLIAWIAVNGEFAGRIELDDEPRPTIRRMLAELTALGVRRAVMLSGDDPAQTRGVALAAGIDEASGGLLPAEKARYVGDMQRAGHRVLMLGDGINDAPVLAAADVGVAIATRTGGIAAETADAVLLSEDLVAVSDAVRIGQRSIAIAHQSIRAGLGLSAVAMGLAAGGYILPVAGALIQEAIDVAVILNALRTARPAIRRRAGKA